MVVISPLNMVLFFTIILLVVILIELFKGKKATAISRKEMEMDKSLTVLLSELRVEAGADRAYVMRFHDGQQFLPSNPVWHTSITHEVVSAGTSWSPDSCQKMLISRISELIEPMITGVSSTDAIKFVEPCSVCMSKKECEKKHKYMVLVNSHGLSGYSRFHLEQNGTSWLIMCGISKKNSCVGLVALDYCNTVKPTESEVKDIVEKLCPISEKIGFMLLGE